jgi:hypothetical protein
MRVDSWTGRGALFLRQAPPSPIASSPRLAYDFSPPDNTLLVSESADPRSETVIGTGKAILQDFVTAGENYLIGLS